MQTQAGTEMSLSVRDHVTGRLVFSSKATGAPGLNA